MVKQELLDSFAAHANDSSDSSAVVENPVLAKLRVELVDVIEHAKDAKEPKLLNQLKLFANRIASEVYIAEQILAGSMGDTKDERQKEFDL